jgi:hypothetical protein
VFISMAGWLNLFGMGNGGWDCGFFLSARQKAVCLYLVYRLVDRLHPLNGESIEPVADARSDNLVGFYVGGSDRELYCRFQEWKCGCKIYCWQLNFR